MNERQKMVTGAIWKTVVVAYQEGRQPEEEVEIPVREVVSALATCVAKAVACVPDRNERRGLIAQLSPSVGRAVADANSGRDLLAPQSGIILPH